MPLCSPLFGDDVHIEELNPSILSADVSDLFPEEQAMMARAVDKRRREFRAGRLAFRRALRALSLPETALVNGSDRAPLWPPGIVASLTHTKGHCSVVMASQSRDAPEPIAALGVDVEQASPLKEMLWDSICTKNDLAFLAAQPEAERGVLGKVIFSAKECAYKAQYTLTSQYLGFHAMHLEPFADGRWRATFTQESGNVFRPGDVLWGRWRQEAGLVATGITLRRESLPRGRVHVPTR